MDPLVGSPLSLQTATAATTLWLLCVSAKAGANFSSLSEPTGVTRRKIVS